MERMRYLLLLLLFSSPVFAQNLILNPGFEDENICTEYQKNCAPEGWIASSFRANYYFDDVRNSEEGQHFVGLLFGGINASINRHFIRSRLLCGLRRGARYKLDFYIRSTEQSLDSIGIYFSGNDMLYQKAGLKGLTPTLWVRDGLAEGKRGTWQYVELYFTATGNENFISLADFRKTTLKLYGRPENLESSYFFLDDFHLTPVNKAEKLCPGAARIQEEEYSVNERHGLLEKRIYTLTRRPQEVAAPTVTVIQRIDTLIMPDVLFATNSFQLNGAARTVLDSFVRRSSRLFLGVDSLVVEGHTDSTGSEKLNLVLSLNRAKEVARNLQRHFVPTIVARGWGSAHPVADNRTPAGRKKNRRVEVYLYIRE